MKLSLSVKKSIYKITSIRCAIFQSESSQSIILIVFEPSRVSKVVISNSAFDSFSIFESPLEASACTPLFTFTLQYSGLKLSVKTLRFSDDCSLSLG